jgi:hypothetical protein
VIQTTQTLRNTLDVSSNRRILHNIRLHILIWEIVTTVEEEEEEDTRDFLSQLS